MLDIQRVALSPQINQLLLFSCAGENHQGDLGLFDVMHNTITMAGCKTGSGSVC